MLPADLRTAEAELLEALRSALDSGPRGRWTVDLRFEGLRLLAPVLRLAQALAEEGRGFRLLFADAGAAALARRDGAGLAERIASVADALRARRGGGGPVPEEPLLLVAPSQAEYDTVAELCEGHAGAVVLINASLEDAAVGIGSVARQRRRGFLAGWEAAYALIPRAGGALRRAHPHDWEVYRLDRDGYRLAASSPQRPDGEQLDALLAGEQASGLAGTLRSVDRLLEGLQN